MKYNININQTKCLEYGLNLQQGAVLDVFGYASSWAEGLELGGSIYYYISAGLLVKELPMISNKKNTFLGIIKKLLEKELIEKESKSNKSFYKLSPKGVEFFQQSVDKNPEGCGKKSTQGVEKNPDNNITIYNTTNITTDVVKSADLKKEALDIYNFYIKQTDLPTKYLYPTKAKEQIMKVLKVHNLEQVKGAIASYMKQTDRKWRLTPVKFFNKASSAGAYYEDYLVDEKLLKEKKKVLANVDLEF